MSGPPKSLGPVTLRLTLTLNPYLWLLRVWLCLEMSSRNRTEAILWVERKEPRVPQVLD